MPNYSTDDDDLKQEEFLQQLQALRDPGFSSANTVPMRPLTPNPRVPAQIPQKPLGNPAQTTAPNDSDVVKDFITNRGNQMQMPTYDDFISAQKQGQQNTRNANIGEGLSDIALSLSGSNRPLNSFDDLRQSANLPAEQLAKRAQYGQLANENDPNSASAMAFKKILSDPKSGYGLPFDQIKDLPLSQVKELATIAQGKAHVDAQKQQAQALGNYRSQRLDVTDTNSDKRIQERAHENILRGIKSDKTINDSITKATNLSNVIANIEKTGVITAQDMHDMQGLAVANMGIGGGTSAHERAQRYANSLKLKVADVEQFLSGKPVDIGQDDPLFGRYKQIMQFEIENYRTRLAKAIEAKASGRNKSVYANRPDLAADLDETKQQYLNQIPSAAAPPSSSWDSDREARYQKLLKKRGGQ